MNKILWNHQALSDLSATNFRSQSFGKKSVRNSFVSASNNQISDDLRTCVIENPNVGNR